MKKHSEMNTNKTFLALLTAALLLSCRPPSTPDPDPWEPVYRRNLVVIKETFDLPSRALGAGTGAIRYENGRLALISKSKESAWVFTRANIHKDSLVAFRALVVPSHDFALGVAPHTAHDSTNVHGYFRAPTRVRYYAYGEIIELIRHFKVGGQTFETVLAQAPTKPFWMELAFKNDSVFYVVESAQTRKVLGRDDLRIGFGDSLKFEIAAHDNMAQPAYIEEIELQYYGEPIEVVPPDTIEILWNPNVEKDLWYYVLEATNPLSTKNFRIFGTKQQVAVEDSMTFRVFAVDSASNISEPSLSVRHVNRNLKKK